MKDYGSGSEEAGKRGSGNTNPYPLLILLITVVLCFGLSAHAATKPTQVEVLYMNHGPLQSTLKQIREVFSRYGDKLLVSWYDVDSKEGEQFKAKKGINQHMPLIIWLDGTYSVKVGEKEIKLTGFPTGSGPAFFQGKWTMDDLKAAIDQVTAKK
jgi:hypothetical protein